MRKEGKVCVMALIMCLVGMRSVLGLLDESEETLGKSNPYEDNNKNNVNKKKEYQNEEVYGVSRPIVQLEVVAVLPDDTDFTLMLSKTLGKSLNKKTTADLLSHLYLPEKNITWKVKNYVLPKPSTLAAYYNPYGLNDESSPDKTYTQSDLPHHHFNSNEMNDQHTFFNSSYSSSIFDPKGYKVINSQHTLNPNMSLIPNDDKKHNKKKNIKKKSGKNRPQNKNSNTLPGKNFHSHHKKNYDSHQHQQLVSFSPLAMQPLCDFLSQTKALAIVNLVGDAKSERILSLVSSSAAIPLIGSSQFGNPLQTLHKEKEDFYINLSTSVRHFARALGHLLVFCHWHSFYVVFDDSPSIVQSQMVWEEELNSVELRENTKFFQGFSSGRKEYEDYEPEMEYDDRQEESTTAVPTTQSFNSAGPSHDPFNQFVFNEKNVESTVVENDPEENANEENYGEDSSEFDDEGYDPIHLNPQFMSIRTRSSKSAFRTLSEITKATQGVIALLCSEKSLYNVFHAARQLRMLNGDYIFILVGQYNQFEEIPEWLPSGLLAVRNGKGTVIGKQTMRSTGSLLASSVAKVKEKRIVEGSGLVSPTAVDDSRSPGNYKKIKKEGTGERNDHRLKQNQRKDDSLKTFPFYEEGENYGRNEEHEKPNHNENHNDKVVGHPEDFGVDEVPEEFVNMGLTQDDGWDNDPIKISGLDNNGHRTKKRSSSSHSKSETVLDILDRLPNISCWQRPYGIEKRQMVSEALTREMRKEMNTMFSYSISSSFDVLNLARLDPISDDRAWHIVGSIDPEASNVRLDTVRWPGGGIFGPREGNRKSYRVVTIVSPPFVMEAQAENNSSCIKGVPCLKVHTSDKDELAVIFADFEQRRSSGKSYRMVCCDGLAMDLLVSVARELKFEIDLFLVPDGYYGARSVDGGWNGIMHSLLSGAAHMTFAPFSVTSNRAAVVDFSTPFFFSGTGLLGIYRHRSVPLFAFLAPFSPPLWLAIFITLNLTALVVALYEWFSPFGLNPWGRQRTKNFSMASALWVVWGRLFSHLVAFKAPKSWPNKFLINVWGGFSVIFVASYTANIAALFAGKFFERAVDVNDRSLLTQKVAAVKHSATDFYMKRENQVLWEHLQRFRIHSFETGVEMLNNGTLDLLLGDRPLLDYHRGTDPLCNLIDVSDDDTIGDDMYSVAMVRGFPLRDSISSLISKYIKTGYMDYLQGKWYGQMPCFLTNQQMGARALGVDAVAGMIIMLALAILLGIFILFVEHVVFRHALPYFRSQPRGTIWRSPNLMFFSQKEYEQRRRRKSKAQFFEMIQEVRRVQHAKKQLSLQQEDSIDDNSTSTVYSIQGRMLDNKSASKSVRIAEGPSVTAESYALSPCLSMPMYRLPPMPEEESSVSTSMPKSSALKSKYTSTHESSPILVRRRLDTGRTESRFEGEFRPALKDKRESYGGRSSHAIGPSAPLTSDFGEGYYPSDSRHLVHRQGGSNRFGYDAVQMSRSKWCQGGDTASEADDVDLEISWDDDPNTMIGSEDENEFVGMHSPLVNQAALRGLTKAQVIALWRTSELDLRRQLAEAIRANEKNALYEQKEDDNFRPP